jgi:hypothetical protein
VGELWFVNVEEILSRCLCKSYISASDPFYDLKLSFGQVSKLSPVGELWFVNVERDLKGHRKVEMGGNLRS